MTVSQVLNAFESVRPRGPDIDIPASCPRRTNHSAAPMSGLLLDANGRRTVDIAPRAKDAITIESRAQSQASTDRRAAISKGGTK